MITLYSLKEEDIDEMVAAFKAIGWNKPRNIYEKYLIEQSNKSRSVFVAKIKDKFCGYVTLKCKQATHILVAQHPRNCRFKCLTLSIENRASPHN
jgi:hypothetical protein